MVYYDEKPIYPMRISDTLSYELMQGEISEQTLYDETTHYIQLYYNRAKILNRSAARLAMSVFQRRLASSTYALLQFFKRRRGKLDALIANIESGPILIEDLRSRLLPGYVRRFVEKAAPLVGISIEGDIDGYFSFRAKEPGALDWLLPVLEAYPTEQRDAANDMPRHRLTVYKPENKKDAIFLHPGEPVFERFREYICGKFAQAALRGGVFIDTNAQQPYIFHLLLISVVRKADPTQRQLARQEILESRLIGLNYFADGRIAQVAPEYLTLLKEGTGIPLQATFLVAGAQESCQLAKAYALEAVAQKLAMERSKVLEETLPERINFLKRGYDYQESELLLRRGKLRDKANAGEAHAKGEMTKIKNRQRQLASLKEQAIATLQ